MYNGFGVEKVSKLPFLPFYGAWFAQQKEKIVRKLYFYEERKVTYSAIAHNANQSILKCWKKQVYVTDIYGSG